LVVVIVVVVFDPIALELPEEAPEFGVDAADVLRARRPQPVGVASLGNGEAADLGKEPGKEKGYC
jgi:hypothetical protein